jgi:protein-L-isoaspartate(D-aspartate) O-methyltransferase
MMHPIRRRLKQAGTILALAAVLSAPAGADEQAKQRERLMQDVSTLIAATARETGLPSLSPRVLAVMTDVPRHDFVPTGQQPYAYQNRPLPIGYGQTISQPYIVALMTELLRIQSGDRVLEIGTGSGYQAAILSRLASEVYTIEIVKPLAARAARVLKALGYDNIDLKVGDGYYGWPEQGPFDAIIVTAAASYVPPPLIRQLKPGGRMVIPVGGRFMTQRLMLIEKDRQGKVFTREILPVAFVPLTGSHE